jgi:di/tricarboxylate transporter
VTDVTWFPFPINTDRVFGTHTPLVLEIATKLKRNPIPYLLATATASNIGSVATITGNPQNILIGSLSSIPYGEFSAALAPVAIVGLVICAALVAVSYRSEFFSYDRFEKVEVTPPRYHGPLLAKSIIVMAVMVVLFFFGQPVAKVAIVGGAYLLLTRRVKPEKVYIEIDWPLLVMFVGLFVVIAGLEKVAITPDVSAAIGRQQQCGNSGQRHRGDVKHCQQCTGRPFTQTICPEFRRPPSRLARGRYGCNASRQFHTGRIYCQSYCRSAGASTRRWAWFLELF